MTRRKTGNTPAAQIQAVNRAPEVLEFFLSSIRDPHNPRHCGACLNGAFVKCTAAERTAHDTNKQLKKLDSTVTSNPELRDAVIGFLMLKRTDKQLERLLARLSTCTCRMDEKAGAVKQYHAEGGKEAARSMSRMRMEELESELSGESTEKRIFTSERCAFIVDLFIVLSMAIHRSSVTSAAKGSSQSWPIHATDLIPHGADSFVQAMLQWYRFVPDTITFQVSALVLRVCQSLVIPNLIKHKFSHTVIESSRQLVDLIMTSVLSEDETIRLFASDRFQFHVTDLAIFFKVLMKELSHDCKAAVIRGCETKAMQICSMVLYLSSDPKMPRHGVDEIIQPFIWYGHDLFRFFHMHMPPRPSMPVHPKVEQIDSTTFPPPASVRAPKETAFFTIQNFRIESRCAAQGCPHTLQSAGRQFQRCSRCVVVTYCSRECQTKAWKEEQYPHKRVCPVLKRLMEKGGGSALFFGSERKASSALMATQFKILSNWNTAGISEEDLTLIEDWGTLIQNSRGYPMPDGTVDAWV